MDREDSDYESEEELNEDLEQLIRDIQELLDNDEYEKAHDRLQMMIDEGHLTEVKELLIWAIKSDDIPMVELLLDNIIDPNQNLLGEGYPLRIAMEQRGMGGIHYFI
jgi:hypothetical protein